MNGYATHQLATIRQQELMREASDYRLAKEARRAAHGADAPTRLPLTSLRKAISMFVSRHPAPKHTPTAIR